MIERKLLDLSEKENRIYQEIARALEPYRNKKPFSIEFVVEGTLQSPIISIRYPGKKLVKLKPKRKNAAEYGNLFDFVVVVYRNGKEEISEFTFEKILEDFNKNKKYSRRFWKAVEKVYYKNKVSKWIPHLEGISPKLFLITLKWLWVQEDFNYKLTHDDLKSTIKYKLLSKRGKPISKGAGRAKFFAALILLKYGFSLQQVKKIIPLYA